MVHLRACGANLKIRHTGMSVASRIRLLNGYIIQTYQEKSLIGSGIQEYIFFSIVPDQNCQNCDGAFDS